MMAVIITADTNCLLSKHTVQNTSSGLHPFTRMILWINSMLQMRKRRHREVEELAHSHCKRQTWDLNQEV